MQLGLGIKGARLQVPVSRAGMRRGYGVELAAAPPLAPALDPGRRRPANPYPAPPRRRG